MTVPALLSWLSVLTCLACSPKRQPASDPPADHRPASHAAHQSNARIGSFEEAKRSLRRIYEGHNVDLYCGCAFFAEPGSGLRVDWSGCGYAVARDAERARRIEWEHAVAASTFGHTFSEWTDGARACVAPSGKKFRGRKCAETSPEFSRIEGDMHNLFPVVGEVNALRGDLPMGRSDGQLHHAPSSRLGDKLSFGRCGSTIEAGVFYPRTEVRGDLARAALYMEQAYPTRAALTPERRAMFARWAAQDPPDDWERERNERIARVQGNRNPFIDEAALRNKDP